MSDYFRHARIVSRSLDWARKTAPVPVGPNLGLSRDGIRFLDPIQAARNPGVVDRRVSGGDRCRHRGRPRRRCRASSSTSIATAPTTSSRRRSDRAALLALLKPRPGLYARLSRDARLRAARPRVSRVPGDLVAGGARLLPQVHGRRAHAADDPQPRAAVARPTSRTGSASATCSPSLPTPELLVLALLLHDVGKWRDDDHAIESVRMARGRASIGCSSPARRARRCCS